MRKGERAMNMARPGQIGLFEFIWRTAIALGSSGFVLAILILIFW